MATGGGGGAIATGAGAGATYTGATKAGAATNSAGVWALGPRAMFSPAEITQSPNHPITQAAGAGPVAVYLVACVSAKVDVFSQALDETSSILPSRLFKPMPCLRG